MRGSHHGSLETLQRAFEGLRRVDVEVVGRLVQQEEIVALQLQEEDLETRFLTTAQRREERRPASAMPNGRVLA